MSDVTITSAAQGHVLYRGASGWANLGPGTSGQFLKTLGADANPAWSTVPGTVNSIALATAMRPLTDFTQVNIASAYTAVEVAGKAITLADTVPGSSFKLAGLTRTVPTAPYRIVIAVQPNFMLIDFLGIAWGFTDGTKFQKMGQYDTSRLGTANWSNSTTRAAFAQLTNYGGFPSYGLFYVCVEDDNAGNVYHGISSDGINFVRRKTVKSTGYLGSSGYTSACFMLQNLGSGGASGADNAYSVTLRKWDEAGLTRTF